jgi:hypothetical protein
VIVFFLLLVNVYALTLSTDRKYGRCPNIAFSHLAILSTLLPFPISYDSRRTPSIHTSTRLKTVETPRILHFHLHPLQTTAKAQLATRLHFRTSSTVLLDRSQGRGCCGFPWRSQRLRLLLLRSTYLVARLS